MVETLPRADSAVGAAAVGFDATTPHIRGTAPPNTSIHRRRLDAGHPNPHGPAPAQPVDAQLTFECTSEQNRIW
jgi:hypothetical protein